MRALFLYDNGDNARLISTVRKDDRPGGDSCISIISLMFLSSDYGPFEIIPH